MKRWLGLIIASLLIAGSAHALEGASWRQKAAQAAQRIGLTKLAQRAARWVRFQRSARAATAVAEATPPAVSTPVKPPAPTLGELMQAAADRAEPGRRVDAMMAAANQYLAEQQLALNALGVRIEEAAKKIPIVTSWNGQMPTGAAR